MWLKFAPHFTYLNSEEETNNEQNMLEKIVKNAASNQSLNDGFLLFLTPLSGHSLLSGHSPFPRDWPFYTGLTVSCL